MGVRSGALPAAHHELEEVLRVREGAAAWRPGGIPCSLPAVSSKLLFGTYGRNRVVAGNRLGVGWGGGWVGEGGSSGSGNYVHLLITSL